MLMFVNLKYRCTYPYAHNYDSQATEDDGSCDWSAYSHHSFDAVTGENTEELYIHLVEMTTTLITSGLDLTLSMQMTYIKMQEWEQVTLVTDLIASYDAYTERRKADSTFLSDTLLDVAAWFAADEAADAQELADSLSDNYARFDAMFNYLSDSISATLDSAAAAFAADEVADAQELADTMADNYARYDAMLAHMEDSVSFTLDSSSCFCC